jgi:hypothetical protein
VNVPDRASRRWRGYGAAIGPGRHADFATGRMRGGGETIAAPMPAAPLPRASDGVPVLALDHPARCARSRQLRRAHPSGWPTTALITGHSYRRKPCRFTTVAAHPGGLRTCALITLENGVIDGRAMASGTRPEGTGRILVGKARREDREWSRTSGAGPGRPGRTSGWRGRRCCLLSGPEGHIRAPPTAPAPPSRS